jgi:nucleotide-binding universal stress UspA family protein
LARFETFLVPHDFSDDAQAALDTAVELARRLGAQLHLLQGTTVHVRLPLPGTVAT